MSVPQDKDNAVVVAAEWVTADATCWYLRSVAVRFVAVRELYNNITMPANSHPVCSVLLQETVKFGSDVTASTAGRVRFIRVVITHVGLMPEAEAAAWHSLCTRGSLGSGSGVEPVGTPACQQVVPPLSELALSALPTTDLTPDMLSQLQHGLPNWRSMLSLMGKLGHSRPEGNIVDLLATAATGLVSWAPDTLQLPHLLEMVVCGLQWESPCYLGCSAGLPQGPVLLQPSLQQPQSPNSSASASVVFLPPANAADMLLPGETDSARILHLSVVAVAQRSLATAATADPAGPAIVDVLSLPTPASPTPVPPAEQAVDAGLGLSNSVWAEGLSPSDGITLELAQPHKQVQQQVKPGQACAFATAEPAATEDLHTEKAACYSVACELSQLAVVTMGLHALTNWHNAAASGLGAGVHATANVQQRRMVNEVGKTHRAAALNHLEPLFSSDRCHPGHHAGTVNAEAHLPLHCAVAVQLLTAATAAEQMTG